MTVFHTTPTCRVLCLAGSLRRDSWSRRLLQAAVAQVPATLQPKVYDALSTVPPFNEDLEQHEPTGPAGVRALHAAVAVAGTAGSSPRANTTMPSPAC